MNVHDYRRMALAFAGAIESAHMGHPDFRAHGRIFATIQNDERGGLMLTPEQQKMLINDHPDVFVPEVGAWGLQGATRVFFAKVDEEALGEALTLAFQNSAARAAAAKAKKQAPKKPVKARVKKPAKKPEKKPAKKPTGIAKRRKR